MFDFIIIAFVIFMLVKQVNRLKKPEPLAAPTTKDCPQYLWTIPIKATKCAHCTSNVYQVAEKLGFRSTSRRNLKHCDGTRVLSQPRYLIRRSAQSAELIPRITLFDRPEHRLFEFLQLHVLRIAHGL